MQATEDQDQPDEYLAAQAATGDQDAFASLYERYFDGVYDFAIRTVRHPGVAADVAQTTFTRAWDRMRKGKAGQNLKVWLYTIARNTAIDRIPRSRLPASAAAPPPDFIGRPPPFAQLDTDIPPRVEAALEDEELVEIVWNSAAALSPKQYSLLDLHLRRRIGADDLAEGLHVHQSNAYTMLSRLRAALAESVAYALLISRSRDECRELGSLLSQMRDPTHSKKTRRALQRHVKTCSRCQANKRQAISPLDIFAGLVLVPAAPGVKGSIWQRISSHIRGVPLPRDPLGRDRALPAPAININPRVAAAVGGLIAVLVVLVFATLLFTSGGGSSGAIAPDPSDVRSADRETGEPSSDNTIEMEWTAVSGAKAYSILWSEKPEELPDTEADLPGTATGTTSPSLDPGTWYFHLRTQGENDHWTATVHAGPFEITPDESDATPRPTEAPPGSTTPTPTPTAVPAPRFPTPEPAPATPAPTPPPTEPPPPPPTPTPAPPPETPTPAPSPATDTPTPAP